MKVIVSLIVFTFLAIAAPASAVDSEMTVQQHVSEKNGHSVKIQMNNRVVEKFNSNGQYVNSSTIKITGTPDNAPEMKDLEGLEGRIRERVKNDLREAFASREAKLRDRIEEMQAVFKKEREDFKAKLQTFRDQRKATVAQNIDEKLAQVNANRTQKFSDALLRLSGVLQNLQAKVDTAKAAGQDTAAAQTAVDNAKKAIEDAQTAVAEQASKNYTAEVSSESALKSSMGEAMRSLQSDLQNTMFKIRDAKKAVIEAARATYQLKIQNEPTPSAAL